MNRILLTVVLSASVLLSNCQEAPQTSSKNDGPVPSVTIAVSTTPLSTPFYVAKNRGLFKKHGVDVQFLELAGGHICLKAMLDGKAHFSTSSDMPTMVNSLSRNDYRLLSTFVYTYNDVKVIARQDKGINTPQDLVGKKVGVSLGTSAHYYLDSFLIHHGIEPKTVTYVDLAPDKLPEALVQGKVDAISPWEPFAYQAQKALNGNTIHLKAPKIYRETFNLLTHVNTLKDKPQAAPRILSALDEAIALIRDPSLKNEIHTLLMKKLGVKKDFITTIWPDFRFALSIDQTLIVTLENEAKWKIKKNNLDKKVPNYLNFIEAGPLRKANPKHIKIIQ